jgi:hypothetical protein
MKWSSALLICALALLTNACEQHKASELEEETHGHPGEVEHTDGRSSTDPAKVKHGEGKIEETKGADAPKFFPEKK